MEARGGIEPPMRVLQTLALPFGYRANVLFGLQRTSPSFITQDYGLCDFFHRAALLPALGFEEEIGFFLTQSEVTLQDAFPGSTSFRVSNCNRRSEFSLPNCEIRISVPNIRPMLDRRLHSRRL